MTSLHAPASVAPQLSVLIAGIRSIGSEQDDSPHAQ